MDTVNSKKIPVPYDTLNVVYPVNKFHSTGDSSTTVGHKWRPSTEVLQPIKYTDIDIKLYSRDHNITKELTRSESTKAFGYKAPEAKRFYQHTSCLENNFIYPPSRQLEQRVPAQKVFGTTEMRSSYKEPVKSPSLVTDKDRFEYPTSLPLDQATVRSSWHKSLEPLDTTHDGFEKYLDPYLTTSRLVHQPFTTKQLARPSVAKDIVTYYTFTDTPFIRTPKQKAGDWWLPLKIPKSDLTYDRDKFKEDFREIVTHNRLVWVPGTFRTEVRDNYVPPAQGIQDFDHDVKHYYERSIAHYPTNFSDERLLLESSQSTENATVGSRKPISAVFDQYAEKNKRLHSRSQ